MEWKGEGIKKDVEEEGSHTEQKIMMMSEKGKKEFHFAKNGKKSDRRNFKG